MPAFLVFQGLADAGLLARLFHALVLIDSPDQFPPPIHHRLSIGIIAAHLVLTVPYFTLLFAQIYRI